MNVGLSLRTVQKFQEELRVQQTNLDKIRYLAEEILQSCHPNAVRIVKYHLTITQTRWEQVSVLVHVVQQHNGNIRITANAHGIQVVNSLYRAAWNADAV